MNHRIKTFTLASIFSVATLTAWSTESMNFETTDSTVRNIRINEVVVTGTREATPLSILPATVSIVGRSTIENAFEPSLLPILNAEVPGLFVTSRGMLGYGVSTGAAGGLKMRGIGGAPTTGMLVLIDGHPQYAGLMGHSLADAYQSMIADKVEVVRGPASMLYGSNAMGGVINILTRKPQANGVNTRVNVGYGSFNTLTSELMNSVRVNKFTSVVTASYNRTDGHRRDMGFEQFGGYAKLGYELTSAWKAFADANVTHFNSSNPGPENAPLIDNDSHITRGMTSFALENDYGKYSGAVKFFYNWGRHEINDGYAANTKPLDYLFNSKDHMLGVSVYESASFFKGNRATAGFDYNSYGGTSWNEYTGTGNRTFSADTTVNEFAAYLNMSQLLFSRLSINAGIRFNHHSVSGNMWIPQAGVSYQLPHTAELKLSVSRGFRNPTIRELFMFRPKNPELKPERLWHYELSYSQWVLQNRLSYGMNVFFIDGDNLISTTMVDGRPLNVNTGNVRNWGIEADMSYIISKHWRASANHSFLHMRNPVLAAPRHKTSVSATYTRQRWSVTPDILWVQGLYTNLNPESQESYFLLNLRSSFKVNDTMKLYVKGENLLARKYEINQGFCMPKATFMGGVDISF